MKDENLIGEGGSYKGAFSRSCIQWEATLQAIGHPALILDPRHKVLAANNLALKLTGKAANELIGKQCYEIFHGESVTTPPNGCPMEKMQKSGLMEATELVMETLDSTFLVLCTPIFDEDGNLEKIIHIATDISEHKRADEALHRSEERFRSMSEAAPLGIFQTDTAGRCLYTNARWQEISGLTFDESLGFGWTVAIHPEDRSMVMAEWDKCVRTRGAP